MNLFSLFNHPEKSPVSTFVLAFDYRNGRIIKKETWSNAIRALRLCFPSARVNLSSILPLNDSNVHVADCISKSNDNMYHAVWDEGELFSDSYETFYTLSCDVKSSCSSTESRKDYSLK